MAMALVFPGQGSQAVGMLADLFDLAEVRACFDEASAALGHDLAALVREGPEERLNQTEHTQPALLTAGVACHRAWRALGGTDPDWLAGHSLGEYTALTVAGVFELADAVRLTALRGRLMQQAAPAGSGAMAAVLNAELPLIESICAQASASAGPVQPANLNSPVQVVISGSAAGVAAASEALRAAGVRKIVPLAVSVPSHSALMAPATQPMAEALAATKLRPPTIPVLHNVDAAPRQDLGEIRQALVRQLVAPVRWTDTVLALAAAGVDRIGECGPGKVLTGLNKRIAAEADCRPLCDRAAIEAALEAWR